MAEFDPGAMITRFSERAATVIDAQRFARAIAAIDGANAEDPTTLVHHGRERPKEVLHSELMSRWLERLDPDAGEQAHLAARAHHFRRWTRARGDYPEGRSGYLRWRTAAKRAHASQVAELLTANGYEPEVVERVTSIIRKDGLGSDRVVQVHEDALCLVFLETQLDDLADRLGEDEVVEILERTMGKMSPAGLQAAVTAELSARGRRLLDAAASSDEPVNPGDD